MLNCCYCVRRRRTHTDRVVFTEITLEGFMDQSQGIDRDAMRFEALGAVLDWQTGYAAQIASISRANVFLAALVKLLLWQVMADAPHVAPLISFLLTLFFVNVLLKSSRDDTIYQRPSFANGLIVLAATFPRISHRKFVKSGKSMLRHRYSTRKYLFILFLLISNDIQLNPGPLNSSTLKSCSLNARSIVKKRTELQAMVATKN